MGILCHDKGANPPHLGLPSEKHVGLAETQQRDYLGTYLMLASSLSSMLSICARASPTWRAPLEAMAIVTMMFGVKEAWMGAPLRDHLCARPPSSPEMRLKDPARPPISHEDSTPRHRCQKSNADRQLPFRTFTRSSRGLHTTSRGRQMTKRTDSSSLEVRLIKLDGEANWQGDETNWQRFAQGTFDKYGLASPPPCHSPPPGECPRRGSAIYYRCVLYAIYAVYPLPKARLRRDQATRKVSSPFFLSNRSPLLSRTLARVRAQTAHRGSGQTTRAHVAVQVSQ